MGARPLLSTKGRRRTIWPRRLAPREAGMDADILTLLGQRLGRSHARQRLGIERELEAKVFGHGLNFFHIENWYSVHSLIRLVLRAGGLYRRGLRNAEDVRLRKNPLAFPDLPHD